MTEDQYNELVFDLEAKNPNHILLPTLMNGYSRINVVYLKYALKSIPAEPTEPESQQASGESGEVLNDSPALRRLDMLKSNLFVKRAKLSNKFHDCTTDKHRAGISIQIQAVQREIEQCFEDIRYVREHGATPDTASIIKPDDLYRKQAVLRNMISRAKRKILTFQEAGETKKKIKVWEDSLLRYQTELTDVTQSIQNRTVQGD